VQFLFNTADTPQSYADGTGSFPEAPERCPHKDCHMPVKMRKHGFYERYVSIRGFYGRIRIRRYRCAVCGRTVSMLPSFCVPYLLHGIELIIHSLLLAAERKSVRYVATRWQERPESLTRRHIYHCRKGIIQNRAQIQLGLNLISPEFVELKQIAGDSDWTQSFLEAVNQLNPPKFNEKYHALTNTSFMSSHNNVA